MPSIDAEVLIGDWDRAVVDLERRLVRRSYIATTQGMLMLERQIKAYLRTYTHPRGTRTPSPPGGPPALVSGNLRRSWRSEPARPGRRPHTAEAHGGPTAVYSRIHELGGEIQQVRTRTTRRPGGSPRTEQHTIRIRIPRRPYVKPMVLVMRRAVRRNYITHWTIAIRGG